MKYEEVYSRAYATVAEARVSAGRYLAFYNSKRPHSSLDARTPDRAYSDALSLAAAASISLPLMDIVLARPCLTYSMPSMAIQGRYHDGSYSI